MIHVKENELLDNFQKIDITITYHPQYIDGECVRDDK